ncbi:related to glutaminyl cyclase (glutaminyl-peptide cyclotransferase) [Phialocephala subalpina]|uniref:Peptide hydrolase n=1 Tax=Phialocephala subalpina TaxID=576137 RepID=A0A1L7XP70_9HELO|nr:related to glutaminyl cyclase (glutaminyl-peptide cyclotransferase) [Phialocephala subalpina]
MFLIIFSLFLVTYAYKPLSNNFLRRIPSGGSDFDPLYGSLLSPILIPRIPSTVGHSTVQHHFVDFFSKELPRWTIKWYNSTSRTSSGTEIPISNLVFEREPPWTKQGQANWLTLAAHYDSKILPEELVGATEAVPCAILMHVARSIDRYVSQMHDEMAELGEGGTVEMDMGVQILLLDGKEGFDEMGPALYGSRTLSETWEKKTNPVGSNYPNALSQISMFVLLDGLGTVNPTIPSYVPITHWAHKNMANIESRMRKIDLLETRIPSSPFLPWTYETTRQAETMDDFVPFMDRGVPTLHLLPLHLVPNGSTRDDDVKHLDVRTIRDWAKIVTGFALEWLDMMEVEPE